MNRPTVSIIIPTYNRAALLPRALDSVVAQTFSDWEIILVDDGSTDDTAQLAADYYRRLGDRFVCIREENRGSSAARNRGIDACHGRFVAFLDSDDEFAPAKLERQLTLFELRPELGFVYSDFAFVDLKGKRHPSAFDAKFALARSVQSETVAPGLYVLGNRLFDRLVRGYFIATIVGMVRREELGRTVRFAENHAYAEEWLFYLTIARATASGFVDEPLSTHHYVAQSLARSDKRRNTVGYYYLLKAVESTFHDLTREQRTALQCNLAQACRQVGFEAGRDDRRGEALAYLLEAFRYRPAFQSLGELARAFLNRFLTFRRTRENDPQPSLGGVR